MNLKTTIRLFSMVGAVACIMVGSAGAASVTYSTNDPATGFNNTNANTLSSTSGQSGTLHFIDDINITTGTPSNVNFGSFTLACPTCTTQANATPLSSIFAGFTFNLVITDNDNGAKGIFIGTSTGGTVFSDVSSITVSWAPLQLGPGTLNASSGDFGSTIFTKQAVTNIVAPNSGATPGLTTVQGAVSSTPEPATFALLGSALLCLGAVGRRKKTRS